MKRFTAFLLVLTLGVSLCACKNNTVELEAPANFYFLRNEVTYGVADGIICSEQQETKNIKYNITLLIEQYLDGPIDDQLSRAVPANVNLVATEINDNKITITLSSQFGRLNGIDLSLACACLCMTILDYTDFDSVCFRADGIKLGENESITMTREDLLLLDAQLVSE